jgi:putative transcriptional regulator
MSKATPTLKGKLILDHGKLHGSFFHRTVILICQHDAEGAFGLVLNRATGHKVGEALVANLAEPLKELPLFNGGPVQQQTVCYLHSDAFLPDANVMANLSLGLSLDSLMDLGDSYSTTQKIKVFAGYAGWAPGQLEDEMGRDTWMIHPASLDLVYEVTPQYLWPKIMKEKGGAYRLLADAPEDLSWN